MTGWLCEAEQNYVSMEKIVASKRNYPTGVEKALFALSRGFCYAPTCKNPVFQVDDDEDPCVTVMIAHICGYPDGPRYNKNLHEAGLIDHFNNLILLCKPHHDKVDGKKTRDDYPVTLLHEWKASREGGLKESLEGLGRITREELKDVMLSVVVESRDRILAGVDELMTISKDTADMIRFLVDEAYKRPEVDPDLVASLEYSARSLQLAEHAPLMAQSAKSLQLQDTAPLVHRSAMSLQLQDTAPMLLHAARSLQLQDTAPMLLAAARSLEEIPQQISRFDHVANRIETALSQVNEMDSAAVRMSNAVSSLGRQSETVAALERASENLLYHERSSQPDSKRWAFFRGGAVFGAAIVVSLFILFFFGLKK